MFFVKIIILNINKNSEDAAEPSEELMAANSNEPADFRGKQVTEKLS